MNVKLLFLDVDGVLNYTGCKTEFDIKCFENLKEFIKKTNCKIIISSTYRLEQSSLSRLWKEMTKYDIDLDKCILDKYTQTPDLESSRAEEILNTLDRINKDINYKVSSFVIMDDCDLLSNEEPLIITALKNNFVRINHKTGLSKIDVTTAVNIMCT